MNTAGTSRRGDTEAGFTLVEILIAIVILGLLSTVTVFAVRGVTNRGEVESCRTDRNTLVAASSYYLAEENTDTIPASGTGVDRFEQTLVDAQLMREVSTYHDLRADGSVVSPGNPCP